MMNLHNIVRGTIEAVKPDQDMVIFRSLGTFTRDEDSLVNRPDVMAGLAVRGQIQSMSADSIVQTERITISSIVRKIYLYSDDQASKAPWALWRPLARSGDYISDARGNQWCVDAVLEDFTDVGWVCVQAILQTPKDTFNIKEINDGGN